MRHVMLTTILLVVALNAPAGASLGAQDELGGTAPQAGYPVRVYFSRHPVSDDSYGAVFPVRRVAPTLGVGTFALRQLLAGPTTAEAAAGYYTEWTQALYGPSTCGPNGFVLRLNQRGAISEAGTATVQLCRPVRIPGVGASARMTVEMRTTLLQFPAVRRVVILTAGGVCFGDLSGLNRCLQPTRSAP